MFGVMTAVMAAVLFCAVSTFAQDEDPPGRVARIAWIGGNVSLQTAGADEWSAAPPNYPMTSGDRLYVDQGGRAVLQNGSNDLRLGGGSDVTLTNLTDDYEQVGVAQGSVRVRVYALVPGGTIEVDTPNGAVIMQQPGDYRINVYPDNQGSVVQVNAGTVQIAGPNVNQEVDQGEAVQLYGTNAIEIGAVDMMPPDDLDRWSEERDRHIQASVSARYVSRDIPGYDDLDDYGSWTPTPDYGPVWYPRSVAAGWQPYTVGHWAYVAPWGYTWVDDAAWGYAPFHYGRWVTVGGRWGWVPGPVNVRPVYAPAFVAFVGGGPGVSVGVSFGGGGGVAAWFPLGVAEPYVPWYRCSPNYVRTVNVTNVNITVIHNTTIVNNYNVFINNTRNVTNVNQIRVTNVNYVNRTRVVVVNQNAMTSGARVQQSMVRLNTQQQQQLARAPIVMARPPVAAPARPAMTRPAVNVSRPVARPVLMTPHGRTAATPTSNRQRFTPASLPKPAPPSAIRPATRPVAPNVRPAAPRPGQPAAGQPNQPGNPAMNRPGQPGNNARPVPGANNNNNHPSTPVIQPRPASPEANRPGAPVNNRPTPPANNQPPVNNRPNENRPNMPGNNRPNTPGNNSRPAPNQNAPGTQPENNRPGGQNYVRPVRPKPAPAVPQSGPKAVGPEPMHPRVTENNNRPPAQPRPAAPNRPAPQARPEAQNRPAPQKPGARPEEKQKPRKEPPPKQEEPPQPQQ
uniref:FecR protein domain-containing protein n=2 Tax=Paracidobacterium acidisoli TaxID=2303751 RepID=A0A372ITX0_9BACT